MPRPRLKPTPRARYACWLFALAWVASAGAQGGAGFSESALPILVLDLPAGDIPDEPKAVTRMRVIFNGPGVSNRPDGPTRDYVGPVGIELRGSSSLDLFPKNGFGLELRGGDGRDSTAALLGMPPGEDWVLHGPYSDKTLIRNAFAYDLARGLSGYAPRTRFVELVLGGEYWGVYLLTEAIRRGAERVDVARLTAADTTGEPLTGGYIVKADKGTANTFPGPVGFDLPPRGLRGAAVTTLQYHYPRPRNIARQQASYIVGWMEDFEAALAADEFEDVEVGYPRYIDEESFCDFLFVNEVVKNVDAYRISTYLHKKRDRKGGRLHMGPVWDFNLALANANYAEADDAEGWQFDFDLVSPDDGFQPPFWYARLWESERFRENAARRWQALRTGEAGLSDARLLGRFDSLATVIGGAVAARNFERWPVLGEYTWPNAFVPQTHTAALAHARAYLVDRLSWLDAQFEAILAAPRLAAGAQPRLYPNPVVAGATLTIADAPDAMTAFVWYDAAGRIVARERRRAAGRAELIAPDAPGLYFYEFTFADGTEMRGRCAVH